MKEFRTTLMLFVVVLALGGWIFLRERGPKKEGIGLVAINPDDVQELKIENEASDDPIVLQKEKKTWRVVKPLSARADPDIIRQVLDVLKDLRASSDVTNDLKGRDLSEYHLKPRPRATISLRLQSGEEQTLRLGDKTVDNQSVYVQLKDQSIVLTPTALFDQVNGHDVNGFRDKKILTVEYNKIEKFALNYPDEVIEVKRKDEREWELTQPIETAADANAVNALVGKFETLTATKFVEEKPQRLKKYGLEKPPFRVNVWVKGRKEPYEISIGNKGKGKDLNTVFAMTNTAKPVVTLAEHLVRDLKQNAKTLRAKTVLSIIPNDVKRFTLTQSGQPPIELERKDEGDKPVWHLKQPVAGRADRETADNVLISLNGQVADDFIDKPSALASYGLEPPQTEVALWLDDSKEPQHVLRIGNKTKTKDSEGVYAQVKGSDTVYRVAGAQWVDKLKVTIAQLRDKEILSFEPADVKQVTWTYGVKNLTTLEKRDGDRWDLTQPQRTEADSLKVMSTFLQPLSYLRGEAFVESFTADPTNEQVKKYGLDKPEATLKISLFNKETNKRRGAFIAVSQKNDQDEVYVLRRLFQPTVYRAKADVLDALRQEMKDLKK